MNKEALNEHFIVLSVNGRVKCREDIWACAEDINGNVVKYRESMKPQEPQGLSEDFMDRPVKRVYCVKCIRADRKSISFITCSSANLSSYVALKKSDTDMFPVLYIQSAVIQKRASGLVFVEQAASREQWYVSLSPYNASAVRWSCDTFGVFWPPGWELLH